jgi:hypothetical protein
MTTEVSIVGRTMAFVMGFIMLFGLLLGAAFSNRGVTAQTGEQSTISALETRVAEVRATSDARGERINAQRTQIADLKTRVAEFEQQAIPTPTTAPIDPYNATGPATEAEKEYFREVQDVIAQMIAPNAATSEIYSDPDFSTDVSLWFELVEAMRPYHSVYAQWQLIEVPTARLENYHQAVTDALYNYDQAATNIEIGVNNFDVASIEAATANFEAATEALTRTTELQEEWEEEADFDVSEDL